jgi:hypothetical protein
MDLLEHVNGHLKDLDAAKAIEDPDERKRQYAGLIEHIALECSCTAYKDQLKNPELVSLLDSIGVLQLLKSWWGEDFAK